MMYDDQVSIAFTNSVNLVLLLSFYLPITVDVFEKCILNFRINYPKTLLFSLTLCLSQVSAGLKWIWLFVFIVCYSYTLKAVQPLIASTSCFTRVRLDQ